MKKVIAHKMQCKKCGAYDVYSSTDSEDKEFSVCYHCGNTMLNKKFDAKEYLCQLMHEGIEDEEELAESLSETLGTEYGWLDFIDVELLAKLLVQNLYEEAKFIVWAEDEDAHEYERERQEAMMGVY